MMNMSNGYPIMKVPLMPWDLVPWEASGPLHWVKRKVSNEQMNK
jgi:hypothetical protein